MSKTQLDFLSDCVYLQSEVNDEVVFNGANNETRQDDEVELVLGGDPGTENKKQVNLHQSLVSRWFTWLTDGLSKES